MEEDFYATMKLTSGEEIVAKVSYDPEDDVIIAFNPRVVEKVEMKKKNMIVEGIVFDDWMNATVEDMFIIPRNQIITMIELDKRIAEYYEDHLNDKSKYRKSRSEDPKSNSKRQDPKNQEGFLGSIKEAKKLLEEIYNKS
jgi:hypothetical protein